ncbi:MAG: methyltransferase domain-containing protein [Kordiimonadaceae bacterium]|nr:methyltransferase domain-containing protein [Kordiimonadaceae bacterium]MBT6328422.1 methyltransferase domain-containing protein [Kordiimonadaceae bacterium]
MTQKKPTFKASLKETDIFNRTLLQLRRENCAENFEKHAFLNHEISQQLIDNLQDIKRDFKTVLNMNVRGEALRTHLQDSFIFNQDISFNMVRQSKTCSIQGDEEFLPVKHQSLDLALSCLNLHWVNDLPGALLQIFRSLKPDGLFLGAMFGGGSLNELRSSMLKADIDHRGGSSPHISPFMDIRDAGSLLQRAGFSLPVASTEQITVTYSDAFSLMKDLKGMGENNALIKGFKGLSSRGLMMKVAEYYQDDFANADGRIPATFDIIYLQGWAPHESQQQPLKPGSAKMALKDALGFEPPSS